MPALYGSVTPRAAAVATAASAALPPRASTSRPTWLASRSTEATAPPDPVMTGTLGCRLGEGRGGGQEPHAQAPRGQPGEQDGSGHVGRPGHIGTLALARPPRDRSDPRTRRA